MRWRLMLYGGALAALLWAAPRLATPWVAEALHAKAAARGAQLSWSALHLDWSGLRLAGVLVEAPGRGWAQVDHVSAAWAWARRPIKNIVVEGVRAEIERVPRRSGSNGAGAESTGRPPIEVRDVTVSVRGIGVGRAATVQLTGARLQAQGLTVQAKVGPVKAALEAEQIGYARGRLTGVGVAGVIEALGHTARLEPQPARLDVSALAPGEGLAGGAWARAIEIDGWRIEQPTLWRAGAGWSAAGRVLGGQVVAYTTGPDFVEVQAAGIRLGHGARAEARLDAAVTVLSPLTTPYVEGRLHLRAGRLAHPRVAPVALDDLHGQLHFVASGDGIGRPHLSLIAERGGVRGYAEVVADALARDATLTVTAAIEPVACQRAFQAIPRGLLGPYADAQLDGRFAPKLSLVLPLDVPRDLRLRLPGLQGACPIQALRAAQTPAAQTRGGDRTDVDWLLHPFAHPVPAEYTRRPVVVGPGQPGYVPLGALPRYVQAVTWLSEDPAFYSVGGLNVHLIQRALKLDLQRRRFVYGGSTLPQQLVKNLFLRRSKTLARKVQELVVAARVADVVPKARILELYLNCIEFAPEVYGIGAAARHYFGVSASALSPAQAVFLATAKPNPRYADALRRRGQTPDTPHYRRYLATLFRRLVRVGALDASQVVEGPIRLGRTVRVDP